MSKDRMDEIVYNISNVIAGNLKNLIDIILDEHYLTGLLKDYFKGYEVHLIPKRK